MLLPVNIMLAFVLLYNVSIDGGKLPDKKLLAKYKYLKFRLFPKQSGILPVKALSFKFNICKLSNRKKVESIAPTIFFEDKSKENNLLLDMLNLRLQSQKFFEFLSINDFSSKNNHFLPNMYHYKKRKTLLKVRKKYKYCFS